MDSVVRAAVVYAVLLLIFRIAGKRSLADITTFDAVLLLIVSEAIQQALLDNDPSMTNAFLVVVTLLGLDIALSLVSIRSRKVDKLVNDVPLVLVAEGKPLTDRMSRSRVTEDDVLEQARQKWGIERLDQIDYAVLERSGAIAIVPREIPWLRREIRAAASGS
jgi:uncharacterized membrane protein YcaP (DUF421 family)